MAAETYDVGPSTISDWSRTGSTYITDAASGDVPTNGTKQTFLNKDPQATLNYGSDTELKLRNELKDTGVSVTALLPGPTETNFFHRAAGDDTIVGTSKKDDPADVAKDGFQALMAGKDKVIAGSLKTKVQGLASELMPPTASA